MIDKLSSWLGKIANRWTVLLFLALDILFNVAVMPRAQAQLEGFSGGIGPLDLTFFPTVDKILSAIAAYGPDGRAAYTTIELTADILYPIAYTFCFSLLITVVLRAALSTDSKLQRLNVLPFGAWAFDLLENVCIVTLLTSFPAQSTIVASVLMVVNGIKWLFAGVSILALLFGLVTWVVKKIRKEPHAP